MNQINTILTVLSLIALAVLAIYRFVRSKSFPILALQFIVLVLTCCFLYKLFGFPVVAPKAKASEDVYFVIILYICMLLGMAAQYTHNRFFQPKSQRQAFDWGLFLAPVFASPIVFIPLLAAMQNVERDLTNLTVPKMMVFFVAFENGFFWKEYFDHRRQAKVQGK